MREEDGSRDSRRQSDKSGGGSGRWWRVREARKYLLGFLRTPEHERRGTRQRKFRKGRAAAAHRRREAHAVAKIRKRKAHRKVQRKRRQRGQNQLTGRK